MSKTAAFIIGYRASCKFLSVLIVCTIAVAHNSLEPCPVYKKDIVLFTYSPDLTQTSLISQMLQKVDKKDIYSTIFDLQNFTTRYVYTQNCNQSAEYIYNVFSSFPNLTVESQYFVYNGYVLRNVIATLPGLNKANETIYMVGGHYDSMNQYGNPWVVAPGADDDASGVSTTLITAKIMQNYRFEATIKFAAWTAEEVGLVGSSWYAANASARLEKIGAYLSFDMVGYDPANAMGLDVYHNTASKWLADYINNMNRLYNINLRISTIETTAAGSDHASFWEYDYPAVLCIENDFNDFYHSADDTVDKLNMEFAERVTKLSIATLAELAHVLPPGEGAIYLDKDIYKPGDSIEITLYDTDLNTNPMGRDFATVNVYSATEPSGECVILSETAVDSGVFVGGVATQLSTPISDGILQVNVSDNVSVEYTDANPPSVKVANAIIDGIPPEIQNVAVIPDVSTAIIRWETNEQADSTVYYDKVSPPATKVSSPEKTREHLVRIINLSPNTLYYFDVVSVDKAGNRMIDDNGGNHYGFTTLTGVASTPKAGFVGYVKESDPTGNYFYSPTMYVGHGRQGIYHGGMQFDIPPLSPLAKPLGATVELHGKNWIYTGEHGEWSLKLLPSSADADWQNTSYNRLHAVPAEATVPPVLTDTDLGKKLNTFYFTAPQLTLLQNHIDNSKISFRLDGPAAGYHLFSWHTGQSGSAAAYAPRFTIRFTETNDTSGPVVTHITVSPNPTFGAEVVCLTATLSDSGTGNSTIARAEYYQNINNRLPMSAVDGIFDTITESVSIKINVKNLPDGSYKLYVRGMDCCGNWGPATYVVLEISSTAVYEFSNPIVLVWAIPVIIYIVAWCNPNGRRYRK